MLIFLNYDFPPLLSNSFLIFIKKQHLKDHFYSIVSKNPNFSKKYQSNHQYYHFYFLHLHLIVPKYHFLKKYEEKLYDYFLLFKFIPLKFYYQNILQLYFLN